MPVESESVHLRTRREGELVDITDKVQTIIDKGKIRNGVAFLFVPGATAALTTIEYEPGLMADLPNMLERVAQKQQYTNMKSSGMTVTATPMLEPL